jgi:hypothetical protein
MVCVQQCAASYDGVRTAVRISAWLVRARDSDQKVVGSRPNETIELFAMYLILSASQFHGIYSASNIDEYRKQKNVLWSRAQPAHKADNLTCLDNVETQPLTTLEANCSKIRLINRNLSKVGKTLI